MGQDISKNDTVLTNILLNSVLANNVQKLVLGPSVPLNNTPLEMVGNLQQQFSLLNAEFCVN